MTCAEAVLQLRPCFNSANVCLTVPMPRNVTMFKVAGLLGLGGIVVS